MRPRARRRRSRRGSAWLAAPVSWLGQREIDRTCHPARDGLAGGARGLEAPLANARDRGVGEDGDGLYDLAVDDAAGFDYECLSQDDGIDASTTRLFRRRGRHLRYRVGQILGVDELAEFGTVARSRGGSDDLGGRWRRMRRLDDRRFPGGAGGKGREERRRRQ